MLSELIQVTGGRIYLDLCAIGLLLICFIAGVVGIIIERKKNRKNFMYAVVFTIIILCFLTFYIGKLYGQLMILEWSYSQLE